MPMLITISISWAPCFTASSVSKALAAVDMAPRGNPTTQHTITPLPARASFAVAAQQEFTHTLAV